MRWEDTKSMSASRCCMISIKDLLLYCLFNYSIKYNETLLLFVNKIFLACEIRGKIDVTLQTRQDLPLFSFTSHELRVCVRVW